MTASDLKSVVREIVIKLAGGEYEDVITTCSASRLSAKDIREVISEYGRTFIAPPAEAYQNLDAIKIRDAAAPTWSVRAPLWSEEEGRSDLELQLTIQHQGEHWAVELDDLLVP
ncbi:MAG: DUF7668 domain-containing protein [Bythopirellula sp.]